MIWSIDIGKYSRASNTFGQIGAGKHKIKGEWFGVPHADRWCVHFAAVRDLPCVAQSRHAVAERRQQPFMLT